MKKHLHTVRYIFCFALKYNFKQENYSKFYLNFKASLFLKIEKKKPTHTRILFKL